MADIIQYVPMVAKPHNMTEGHWTEAAALTLPPSPRNIISGDQEKIEMNLGYWGIHTLVHITILTVTVMVTRSP